MPPDDEDYFVPLEDQRVFGAGISRKRVQFVRSSDHELNTTRTSSAPTTPSSQTGPSIANKYLSIVLSKSKSQSTESTPTTTRSAPNSTQSAPPSPSSPSTLPHHAATARCEVCQLPLTEEADFSSPITESQFKTPHEASIAHQVCLTHSHPPSHLDRTRHGLRYLSAYGWDPDSRRGLGAPGREGIREPLKGKLKIDTVGLGAEGDSEEEDKKSKAKAKAKERAAAGKVEKLNAKQVRKGHADAKKRGDRLREMFYQNDDVQRYLSGGG